MCLDIEDMREQVRYILCGGLHNHTGFEMNRIYIPFCHFVLTCILGQQMVKGFPSKLLLHCPGGRRFAVVIIIVRGVRRLFFQYSVLRI